MRTQKKGAGPESSFQVRTDCLINEADMNSYEAPNHVIRKIVAVLKDPSLPIDSLVKEISRHLEENWEVGKTILESQTDKWNNSDLLSMVEEYFENSKKTLDFCDAFDNCLKCAQNNQLIIQSAVKHFEEEVDLHVGTDEKKFVKTLEELSKFQAAEQPFTKDFFLLIDIGQQKSMLLNLRIRKKELDKKFVFLKTWSRVPNVLFVLIFVSLLIFSVVAVAKHEPAVVIALPGAIAAVPLDSLRKWFNSLWKHYENKQKDQEQLINIMGSRTYITITHMETITVHAKLLQTKIESMLKKAVLARQEEDTMKLAIDMMKRELKPYIETTKKLGEEAEMRRCDVWEAMTAILQRLMRPSSMELQT